MMDLMVFSVGKSRYTLSIENVYRITQADREFTTIPNANELIDGMMSYEGSVVKVLNFRKLVGMISYEEELKELFKKNKESHVTWVGSFKETIDNDVAFHRELNPNKCELGRWLKNFNPHDDDAIKAIKELSKHHRHMHVKAAEVLQRYTSDKTKSMYVFKSDIEAASHRVVDNLNLLLAEVGHVADSLQKLIIYKKDNVTFAIKVDSIEDIIHIEESKILHVDEEEEREHLKLSGAIDLEGDLIDVIKTISIPS